MILKKVRTTTTTTIYYYYYCFVVVVVAASCCCCHALRHNFVANQDARTMIAPIGAPYGFVRGGCFAFDVKHFSLHAGKRHYWKIGNQEYDAGYNDEQEEEHVLKELDAGFLLKRFKSETAFAKYQEEIMANSSSCIFESFRNNEEDDASYLFKDDDDYLSYSNVGDVLNAAEDGIFLPIRRANSTWHTSTASIEYVFEQKREEGLYFLLYQVCLPHHSSYKQQHTPKKPELRSSFEIEFHYKNKDLLTGEDSYLTAGDLPLPLLFFYFFISYGICSLLWIVNLYQIQRGGMGIFISKSQQRTQEQGKPKIYAIHHLMSVLMVFKTFTVLFESIRYHYIRRTGHAEFWSVLYYGLSFVKSVFLFTVVLLIGSGWSFVKPFLNPREKQLICVVLVLQVLDNVALLVLNTEAEGESLYDDWSALLHMLDILCCGAILVPIVWQVHSLEKSLEDGPTEENDDDDEANKEADEEETTFVVSSEPPDRRKTLEKLKLFRTFYVIVVAYIYLTRIAVYLFATLLDYRHTWFRTLFLEMATLAFYVAMGLQFRPMVENPYLTLSSRRRHQHKEDDDDDDNNDTTTRVREIEMKSTTTPTGSSSSSTNIRSKGA